MGAVFDVGLSSALRGQRRRQVQVRPDRHAAEYGRHGDGRSECGSRQVVRDGPKQSARGLHTEWGTTMSVPMPSAKNCGLDASMRGFRPELHASTVAAEHGLRRVQGEGGGARLLDVTRTCAELAGCRAKIRIDPIRAHRVALERSPVDFEQSSARATLRSMTSGSERSKGQVLAPDVLAPVLADPKRSTPATLCAGWNEPGTDDVVRPAVETGALLPATRPDSGPTCSPGRISKVRSPSRTLGSYFGCLNRGSLPGGRRVDRIVRWLPGSGLPPLRGHPTGESGHRRRWGLHPTRGVGVIVGTLAYCPTIAFI